MGTGCGDVLHDTESKAPDVTEVSDKQHCLLAAVDRGEYGIRHQQCTKFGAAAAAGGLALAAAVSLEVLLFSLLLPFISTHAVDNIRVDTGC